MENKGSENQFQTMALKEIGYYDVGRDERGIVVDDVCNFEELAQYGAGMNNNLSVISSGMIVDGDLNSSQSISLKGRVNGNVTANGNIDATGLVVGDIKADSVHFDKSKVHGNSVADNLISVEEGTVIVGDLTAKDITVNGKVKGYIKAARNATFKESAVVIGDVKTGSINVDGNAKVNANITLVTDNVVEIDDGEFSFESGV